MRVYGVDEKLPISTAVAHGGLLYISGHVGFDEETGEVVPGGIEAQTRQTLKYIDMALHEAGVTRNELVTMRVFLKDVERDFGAMNKVFAEWIGDHRPARTTVGSALAVSDLLIEVDGIAALPISGGEA
ncbi:MAG: RidA family protein [Planctomycetota bacterium]